MPNFADLSDRTSVQAKLGGFATGLLPVQPWSTSMLAEIFMLRLEEAARAAKEAAPHRSDYVAGCEGVLTRAAAARLLSARPGHAVRSSR
jgi:hypothetical protein